MNKNDLLGKTIINSRDGCTYIVTGIDVKGFPDRVRCTSSWCPLPLALPLKDLTLATK